MGNPNGRYDFNSGKFNPDGNIVDAVVIKEVKEVNAELLKLTNGSSDDEVDSKSLRENLKAVYQEMLTKYNIQDVEYKDFESVIVNLAEYTKKTSEYNKLFLSKLTNAIAESTQINCIFALGKLINIAISKALEVVQKEINTDPDHSLNVCVSIINQSFTWLQQVDSLRTKYNIPGDSGALTNLSKQTESKSDSLPTDKIRDIISRINKATTNISKEPPSSIPSK